jgi:subtilisin family serine protease
LSGYPYPARVARAIAVLLLLSPLTIPPEASLAAADRPHVSAVVAAKFKAPHVPGELIVKVRDQASKRVAATLELAGASVVEASKADPSVSRIVAAGDADARVAAAALAQLEDVEFVEPNYVATLFAVPNDPRFREQWGLDNSAGTDIGAASAWDRTTGSEEVVVGVIDTGMDVSHPDLRDNLFRNPGEVANNDLDDDGNGYVDDTNGWDGVTDTGTIRDDNGHGTHVSGIIGARGNNGQGIAGVAWRVRLLPLRYAGGNSGSVFDALQCLDYAVTLKNRGVNVRAINNSWGGGGFSQALAEAVGRANNAGILLVCAAGNSAADNDASAVYPAGYDFANVISVGATSRTGTSAGFSNFGATSVDVFAPGDGILSTVPAGGFANFNGTSQASPHVAGIAALIAAAEPDASIAEMKARILGGALTEPLSLSLCLTGGRASAANSLRTETTPPGDLADFRLTNVTRSTIAFAWTAVGDDGAAGRAVYYDVRWSNGPISASSFESATQLSDARLPARAGESETGVIRGCFSDGSPIYVAMRVYDEAGNFSQSATLLAEPSGPAMDFGFGAATPRSFELGESIGLEADDEAAAVELDFDFPYFGGTYRTIYVSTNGLVTFDEPVTSPVGDQADLGRLSALAPLWLDLRTDGNAAPNEGVFVRRSSDSIAIRWIAEPWFEVRPESVVPVTFEVTLFDDGRFEYAYGPGNNTGLRANGSFPVVGASDGGCAVEVLTAYSGVDSLANAPAVAFRPKLEDGDDGPRLPSPPIPTFLEGIASQFVVTATDDNGDPLTVAAALPRNATFDAATGVVRFVPDSSQDGPVQFVFSATDPSGKSESRTVLGNVQDNGNLPEVNSLIVKRKVTFLGIGYRIGTRIEVDGTDVGDAKNNKRAPATKLVSKNARAALSARGLHTIVAVNPDGTRSGPFFWLQ